MCDRAPSKLAKLKIFEFLFNLAGTANIYYTTCIFKVYDIWWPEYDF